MSLSLILIMVVSQVPGQIQSSSSATGFSTVLTFEEPELIQTDEGELPVFAGVPTRAVPGEPLLPCRTLFIPVPSGAVPRISFRTSGLRSTGATSESPRARALEGEGLDAMEVAVPPVQPPSEHVVLEGVIPLAGATVAVVSVYPIAGEPGFEYVSRIELELDWTRASGGRPVADNPLLNVIAPEDCLYWPSGTDQTWESIFWGRPWARMAVSTSGGYEVSGTQLENAGCQVTGAPTSSIAMYTGPAIMFTLQPDEHHELQEIAVSVTDVDQDGIFDEEDSVRFFGRGLSRWEIEDGEMVRLQHRYATHNVYWLTWGGEDGLRMNSVSGEPDASPGWGESIYADIWLRDELIWKPKYETSTGWVWQSIAQGETIPVTFQVVEGGSCDIEVGLIVDGSSQHTVELSINGNPLLTDNWYGTGERILNLDDVQLSGTCNMSIDFVFDAGDSELSLAYVHVECPSDMEDVTGEFLFPSRQKTGRFNFSVPGVSSSCQAFDLTDHYQPVAVTGGEHGGGYDFSFAIDSVTVLAVMDQNDWETPDSITTAEPGRLIGTVDRGDRLVVVHPSMQEGIWAIETLLDEQGYVPVIATTSEIYDEFGQGIADPGAIRSAVRWGMDTWTPGLTGLILAGDGHYDIKGNTTSQPVMIPPWIVLGTFQWDCLDDLYVMAHAGAVLPEIPVSRIPADNLSQLGTFIAKLLEYETTPSVGEWTGRTLIIADDEWGQGTMVGEASHTNHCELISEEVIPRWLSREKFYLIEYPWPPGTTPDGPHPEKPQAREDFLELMDRGFLFTYYEGHGAENQIAHEVLMLDEDVSSMQNGVRLPATFWATCDVGHFDNPGTDAIAELLVLHPAGGGISSIAATRGTNGYNNYSFFRSLLDSLCTDNDLTLGEALWQSKLSLSGNYGNNRYYVLLGYPETALLFPDSQGVVSITGDTLRSGESNTILGSGLQQDGLAFIRVLESSWYSTYTGLGGTVINYLKYGGTAYSGTQDVVSGEFSIDCFIPLQAATGSMARAGACAISEQNTCSAAMDPAVLVQGNPSGSDMQGPEGDMWIRGYEGVQNPQLTGDATLLAELADSSGICILGGSGKELNLFIDGSGNNVSDYFSYYRGSSTAGMLEYDIETLSDGEHTLILWSVDGLGNSSRDTLEITVLQESELSVSQALVYPNPGEGARCFSFRISEDAQVSVSIYTVAGTRIDEITRVCTQGYNQIMWDGLDHDGDPVASGPYIYKIRADALGTSVFSRTAEEFGIMAVIREE
jgi:hypothetical protein